MMILGVTGHRPTKLGGYSSEVTDRLVELAVEELRIERPELVISGMALGWDMAVAEAAFCLGIPFHAYIPFQGQESMWPAESQRLYHKLCAEAGEILACASPGYAAWKLQYRNRCVVDASDKILALWDGSSGGTANCIEFAGKRGVPVKNIWSRYG